VAGRIALVGLSLACLAVITSLTDLGSYPQLYWISILLSILGIVGAAALGSRHSTLRYSGSVISTLVGVLIIGRGIENHLTPIAVIGVFIVIAGIVGVMTDTRRLETSEESPSK